MYSTSAHSDLQHDGASGRVTERDALTPAIDGRILSSQRRLEYRRRT